MTKTTYFFDAIGFAYTQRVFLPNGRLAYCAGHVGIQANPVGCVAVDSPRSMARSERRRTVCRGSYRWGGDRMPDVKCPYCERRTGHRVDCKLAMDLERLFMQTAGLDIRRPSSQREWQRAVRGES